MDTVKIPLAGSVGVAQAEQLHASIHEAFQTSACVQVDFSEVCDIDASILQLLIAAEGFCREEDATLEFIGFTKELTEMLRRSGANQFLATISTDSKNSIDTLPATT